MLLLLLVLAASPGTAQAFDDDAAIALLSGPTADGSRGARPACSHIADWGPPAEGLHAVVAAEAGGAVVVALMRAGEDGAPAIVAGPARFEPVTIDPLWACSFEVVALAPLGRRPLLALHVFNSYTSTARSSSTLALHLLVREGDALRPIFGSLLHAAHSETVGRRRQGWERRYVVVPAPARPEAMPDLEVRDRRTRQVLSRHLWRDGSYQPPVFDRMGPLGPG
ncbi:MAG TPA: hypothetical protein VD970_13835 [Acetobacteraceae bacterium]|nr:hypothetical protein [Acetobacteraceae bacterium]